MFPASTKKMRLFVAIICISATTNIASVNAQSVKDEYRLAAGYYSRSQWDETATAFRSLIEQYPNTQEASAGHFFLGESLMQIGEFAEAYNAYQVFLQRLPDHLFAPRATFRMGEAAYRVGNFSSAIKLLQIYVRENPEDALNEFALPYLGEIRLKQNEPQLAQRAYERALEQYPQSNLSNQCRLGLAKALQMQGAEAEAIRFYEFLVNFADNDLVGEAQLRLGMIKLTAGDDTAAQQHLLKALPDCDKPESRAEAAYWLARTFAAQGDFERASELLASVTEFRVAEPLASAILFDGAISATKIGNVTMANRLLSDLRRQFPDNDLCDDALHLQVELSQRIDESTNTEKLADQFLDDFPDSPWKPSVLEVRGRIAYQTKAYKRAASSFAELLEDDQHLHPEQADLDRVNWRYMQGLSHLALAEFPEAESVLEKIDPADQTDLLRPSIQISLATARFGLQKFESGIENYRHYLRLAPEGSEAARAGRS